MGLQELEHLKKTLRKIGEKKIRIPEIESDLVNLKDKKIKTASNLNRKIKSLKKANKNLKRYEKEAEDTDPFTEADQEKLVDIYEKIKTNENAFEKRAKIKITIAHTITTIILALFIALNVGLIPLEGDSGQLTLLMGDESTKYQCDNGKIIPAYYVNDGKNDCGDGSDEDVPETEELVQAIEESESDSYAAVFTFLCVPTLVIPCMYYFAASITRTPSESLKLRKLNAERQDLMTKKSDNTRRINAPKKEKSGIKGLENEISSEELALSKLEASISKNEAELQVLSGEIEEHYESIKHLIPFGHKLESDQ